MPSHPASAIARWNSCGKPPSSSLRSQYSSPNRSQSRSTAARISCCSGVNVRLILTSSRLSEYRPLRAHLYSILNRGLQRSRSLPLDIVPSVCPHDCPSACALEVERIDGRRIGWVRGAKVQTYTRGVVCAKVARYAERQHHPARLSRPLRRVGEKGIGEAAFAPISWDEGLDEVAEKLTRAAQRYGCETVWPYYYAGTMGLVQRDGINRLRHAMRYSREH